MSNNFVVIWDGSHHGTGDDLLFVPDPVERPVVERPATWPEQQGWRSWASAQARMLELLAQRDRWRIKDLATAAGLQRQDAYAALQQLRRQHRIVSAGFGFVAVVRKGDS